MKKCLIITPVYNDWVAFTRLVQEIELAMPRQLYDIHILAVDDCSATGPEPVTLDGSIASITVLRLALNLGHQRAIAIGLVEAESERDDELVAVMDSDGEDLPSELKRMIDSVDPSEERVVVAQRSKRSESFSFRLHYAIYVQIFRALTGHKIDFGNFSVLCRSHVRRLVHNANIWNNYAATLIQTKMPIHRLATIRGKRYAGQSQMRFVSLITHGLGAISVFTDAVFIRILVASFALFGVSILVILAVLVIRFSTGLAVPGWATNVLGFAFLLSAQALMMPILLSFVVLGNRSALQTIPAMHAQRLVERRDVLYRRADSSQREGE